MAFILNLKNVQAQSHNILFSIHDETVPVFRLTRMRARRMPDLITDSKELLLKLLDADVEFSSSVKSAFLLFVLGFFKSISLWSDLYHGSPTAPIYIIATNKIPQI